MFLVKKMKVIFILAFIATLFAITSAYYPGGPQPTKGLLGATRGELREWILEEEEEQRLKIKGLLKEIGRKVVVPKIVDKLQTLEEEDVELGKVIAALEESAEDGGAEELVGGHFREHLRVNFRPSFSQNGNAVLLWSSDFTTDTKVSLQKCLRSQCSRHFLLPSLKNNVFNCITLLSRRIHHCGAQSYLPTFLRYSEDKRLSAGTRGCWA